jgi:SAM-dependent methyltransferase
MAARTKNNSRKKKKKNNPTMAERADLYELYEAAVQNVPEQVRFIDMTFEEIRGRKPLSFREDFCGTASAACEWVRQDKNRYAFGVDYDQEVLNWGRSNRMEKLGKRQQQRIALMQGDVRTTETPPVDVVGAFNFSYWIFQQRDEMLNYFKIVHENLSPDGVFFLDAFGGYDALKEMKEKMDLDGFTYVWEQARYCPVTANMQTHIHFRFPDGSKLKKAFSYEWRLWTLPEIKELLLEAGFQNTTIRFEYFDDDGQGLGLWYPDDCGEASSAWIANITAEV